jgi:hypothetical protein
MAFIKLIPRKGRKCLPVNSIVRLLKDEFTVMDIDRDEGQNHVAGMIAATLRFSDSLPFKQEQLTRLQSVQPTAVFVTFGDNLDVTASCCLMEDTELFFGYPDEVDGPARPLVERAAKAIGYTVFEG